MGRVYFEGTDDEPVRVRVPGAQVAANKSDQGDRPCILVIHKGAETLCHDVAWGDILHGGTLGSPPAGRITQDFANGCPVTGAVIWLELVGLVVGTVRQDVVTPAPCIGCGGRR